MRGREPAPEHPLAAGAGPSWVGSAAEHPFAALGDANRLRIVKLLSGGPRSVGELAEEMPISRPAVSRHLRLLKEAGLVTEAAAGTRRIYRLDAEGLSAVEASLRDLWGEAATRFRLVAENTQPRTDDRR